jgi:MFS family permease
MPIAMGFCIPQSSPHRRGLNVGLLQVVAVGLFATFLGPLVQVRLAENIGWRWTFVSTIIPGIIIAWLIYKVLIDPTVGAHKAADRAGHAEKPAEKPEKGAILKALLTRNIALSVIGSFFLYCWYVCMLTYLPSYLMQVVKLTPIDMSYVMSALGVGSIVWGVVLPKASDSLGRKPLTIVGLIMACAGTFGLLYMPHSLGVLIAIAFVAWAGNGVFALLATTIPTESGDPRFSASITGFVQLTGELVGATAGAIIIGHVADIEGLTTAVSILGVLIAVPIVTSLFYKETAPAVLAKRQEEAGVA